MQLLILCATSIPPYSESRAILLIYMDKLKVHNFEKLLEVVTPGGTVQASDICVLSCGCLASESNFTANTDEFGQGPCPTCNTNGRILAPVIPLRDLYSMLKSLKQSQQNKPRRHSSSRKSVQEDQKPSMDLLGLFYNYARDDPKGSPNTDIGAMNIPNVPDAEAVLVKSSVARALTTMSISPDEKYTDSMFDNGTTAAWESLVLSDMTEQSEYNFSKCFPLYRKVTTFQTQQPKFNMSALTFRLGSSMIRKTSRYANTCVHSFMDHSEGREVSRYALLSSRRWEVHLINNDTKRSMLISCGKSTGEYGPGFGEISPPQSLGLVVRNDFTGSTASNTDDISRQLDQWELIQCRLSRHLLLLAGSRGILRLLDISGKPLYTYVTNFPIRCVAISPNEKLIACAITAKERVSGKEQPFIILHNLQWSNGLLEAVEPITITIPYRDPIKLINFNLSLSHLICCTVWESRYFVVKLRGKKGGDFYRPRLVWTDARDQSREPHPSSDRGESDDDIMMDNEGITDIQFGKSGTNTVVLTFCSLKNRPPIVIQLEGETMDRAGDTYSLAISRHSSSQSFDDDDDDFERSSAIKSAFPLFKLHQVGTYVHRVALLPRGDGMAFLDREGRIYVAATPNFSSRQAKRLVVLLGETMGAERHTQSSSLRFSADGSKIFVVDRRGLLQVYDFAKGVPGSDVDVLKAKLIAS